MRLISALHLMTAVCLSSSALAEVRLEGEVEYGIFENPQVELEPGERMLRTGQQPIQRTSVIPVPDAGRGGARWRTTRQVRGGAGHGARSEP